MLLGALLDRGEDLRGTKKDPAPDYADYNFTAHPDLEKTFGEGFTDKLQKALIAIDDPRLLSAFPREALIEAKNEDFQGIEDVAKALGFLR